MLEDTKEQKEAAEGRVKDLKMRLSLHGEMGDRMDEDGHALNEEGLRFVDIRETEAEAESLHQESRSKGKEVVKEKTKELGEFERKMLARLQQYEAEDDEDETSEEESSEDSDVDDDDDSQASDSFDNEWEDVGAKVSSRQKTSASRAEAIKTPADIYDRMKSLSLGSPEPAKKAVPTQRPVAKNDAPAQRLVATPKNSIAKPLTAKKKPEPPRAMTSNVVEREMEEFTETDMDNYMMQKEVAEEYLRKREQLFDEDDSVDEEMKYAQENDEREEAKQAMTITPSHVPSSIVIERGYQAGQATPPSDAPTPRKKVSLFKAARGKG
ncbi:hypothetical protein HDU96_009593 [Phlyctochytrium bullatum]|nr:hypothetical protein HDU96_009593 [Phlyctochytrium bullatum]